MTSGIQSKGTDLDSIFATYVSGTHPAATGIEVNGADIATRYQPLPGTAAAATGIETNGADLNTLFSTTAGPQTLPINGESYNAGAVSSGSTPIKPAQANVYVQVGDGQYNVQTYVISNGAAAVVKNNQFTLPSGVTAFTIALSNESTSGAGTSLTNTATGQTSVPSSLTTYASANCASSNNSGTYNASATVTLNFYSGAAESWTGTFTIDASSDISA